jgi:N-acetylglucosaminyldiphosphoundecaprenol N-acetyl-beta-D-mannosaminyltransferase
MTRQLRSLAQRRLVQANNLLWEEQLGITTRGIAEADTRTDERVPCSTSPYPCIHAVLGNLRLRRIWRATTVRRTALPRRRRAQARRARAPHPPTHATGERKRHRHRHAYERELQNSRLVVNRRTKREIAAELYLNQKTIGTHLRNIFRKLDATRGDHGGHQMLEPALAEHLADAQWVGPCARCASSRSLLTVNTVAFDVLSIDAFSEAIIRFKSCGNSHVVHFLAAHPTVVARQVPTYGELLANGDLVVSDGAPVALTMLINDRHARRITSTDGFFQVCSRGLGVGLRHYFVGGANEAVAEAILRNLTADFPGIEIVGFEVPPFRPYSEEELDELVKSIRSSSADVVWVGLGAPKQEILSHRLRAADAAPAIVTIGATFDFVAGTKPRAPRALRACGLEWLFRLTLEPRRLWRRYLVGNVQFIAGLLTDGVRRQ